MMKQKGRKVKDKIRGQFSEYIGRRMSRCHGTWILSGHSGI